MGLTTNIWMFLLFSATIIIFSFFTIFSRRILRAAVSLLFVLVATSGIYFMMNFQFMAGVQLALYAGGIVVLIIFSILLTSKLTEKFDKPNALYLVIGGIVALFGGGISIYSVWNYAFPAATEQVADINMKMIGTQLLGTGMNGYALPFEVISILLLGAMIAAIVIAKK